MKLKLSESERRTLLAAGMGAGIAAIFKAPLAGAIFAIEVLYRDEDFEAEALIPAFISCTVAYCVFGLMALHVFGVPNGFKPLFSVAPQLTFNNPLILVPLTILAVGMAAASFVYVRCFYGTQAAFKRLKVPPHFRPAIGALATGLFGLGFFYALVRLGPDAQVDSLNVLSFGYGIIQKMLSNPLAYGTTTALVLLAAVGLGKILTTSLTIGSGGSGGVFGPSMVIGGTLGGVIGLLLHHVMPTVVTRVDVFVILGMASFFSAAAKTPVSTIIMVSELTGGYELLLPAMWVSALAYLLSRGWSIYREQVASRLRLAGPSRRIGRGAAARPDRARSLEARRRQGRDRQVRHAADGGHGTGPGTTQTVFPIVDAQGSYVGVFGMKDIRRFLYDRHLGSLVVAGDLMFPHIEPLRPDTDLGTAMVQFADSDYDELPVVSGDAGHQLLGIMHRQEILTVYNTLVAQVRPAGGTKVPRA